MARIANVQERRQEQTAQIWRGIVDYANGDASVKDFEKLAVQCFERMGMRDAAGILNQAKDAQSHALLELMDRYREPIRDVLRWLIGPEQFGETETEESVRFMVLATDAVRFLHKHADSFRVEYHPKISISEDATTSKVSMWREFSNIGSVITGVCNFVLEQVDRHDLHGEPIAKVFPFGVCERQGCGRFFIVQRAGRARFCSDNCRSLVGKAKLSKEDKAAYMKQYRAAKALEESRAERAKLRKAR